MREDLVGKVLDHSRSHQTDSWTLQSLSLLLHWSILDTYNKAINENFQIIIILTMCDKIRGWGCLLGRG